LFYTVPVPALPNAPDAGPDGVATEVRYLASFDGETWQPPPGVKPVLAGPAAGPCVVPDGASTVLFFAQEQRLHLGVAAAVP
jgi:hypothetical protein